MERTKQNRITNSSSLSNSKGLREGENQPIKTCLLSWKVGLCPGCAMSPSYDNNMYFCLYGGIFGTAITPDKQVPIEKDVGLMSQSYGKYTNLKSSFYSKCNIYRQTYLKITSNLTHCPTALLLSDEYCAIAWTACAIGRDYSTGCNGHHLLFLDAKKKTLWTFSLSLPVYVWRRNGSSFAPTVKAL